MATRGRFAIILSVLLATYVLSSSLYNHSDLHSLSSSSSKLLVDNNSYAELSSGASSELIIGGEPSHVGDFLTGTIIVTNTGNETGTARLRLYCIATGSVFEGPDLQIPPGSSREAFASFVPEIEGNIEYSWSVNSSDSQIDNNLQGNFSIGVSGSQDIELSIDGHTWDGNSLIVQVSSYLSSGRLRSVDLVITDNSSGFDVILQEIPLSLNPGIRSLQITLGAIKSPQISIELIPENWQTSVFSSNKSSLLIDKPILNTSSLSLEATVGQTSMENTNIQISYQISNNGDVISPSGTIRVISLSNMQILQETPTPDIGLDGSYSGFFIVPHDAEGYQGEIQILWSTGSLPVTTMVTFDPKESDEEFSLPFDLLAASYGVLAGIALILVGKLAWRTVSSRTPHTSESSFRETRKERDLKDAQEKKLVLCPHCEQHLNVPSNHLGSARCPTCSMEFEVMVNSELMPKLIDEKQQKNGDDEIPFPKTSELDFVRSSDDLLNCPECDQALRVPIEKRPVQSRCPICKFEFIAEISEE